MAGKTERKRHVTSKTWQNYTAKGDDLSRKNISCPKCGQGVFLANHGNRKSCGKCGYSEFNK